VVQALICYTFDVASYKTLMKKILPVLVFSLILLGCSISTDTEKLESPGENSPVACMADYAPVCGQIDTGIRCITTPCPATEEKTFSNSCNAAVAGAKILYSGECQAITDVEPQIPENCTSWFDGCNRCFVENGEIGDCVTPESL